MSGAWRSELFDLTGVQQTSAGAYQQSWQERLLVFALLCAMVGWLSRWVFAIRSQLVITNDFDGSGPESRGSSSSEGDEEEVRSSSRASSRQQLWRAS